ncbi:MAG: DUF6456 domain-containing protein [Sphingomonas fennica]
MAKRMLAERALPGDAGGRRVTVNLAESPLGWLAARGLVTPRQQAAGERLRGDWTIAGLGPRVTMRWEAGARSTGEGLDPATAQLAAKRRFEGAVAAAGPGMQDIAWRVICDGQGMADAEQALGWPKRAGRLVLSMALDRIADYYGCA